MPSHSGLFTVIERAARKAAPRLRRDFNEVQHLQVSRKGPADFVSMADKRSEQTLVEELRHDNAALVARFKTIKQLAGDAGDNATEGLVDDWTDQAERRVWFLAQTLK